MIGWWILGILLLVLLLLCLTRVGVLIRFGEELTVSARFGFLKFQVLPEKKKPPKNEKKTGRSAEKADAKAGEAEEGVPEAHAQRHSGRMEGPVAAAEKGAAPYPPGRADRSAGCVRYFRGTGGTCGRRAAIRRAARGRLDRDAGAGTTAGDPPAAYPPGC